MSLDVLRGVTVAGMILVTNPGSYSAVYPQLLHADWQGATAADMIFPCFLVMVGVALTLSLGRRMAESVPSRRMAEGVPSRRMAGGPSPGRLWWHLLRRSLIVLAFGLVVNAFSDFDVHTLRLPGVLQRIAVCYLLAGSLYLPLRRRFAGEEGADRRRRLVILLATAVGLLVLYTLLLRLVPVPGFGAGRLDSNGSLPAYVDRRVFGIPHLWTYGTTAGVGVTFDPEGLLSTISALASTLLGVFSGELLRGPVVLGRRVRAVAVTAAILLAFGIGLEPVLPWIKKIYTASFACFSTGVALAVFALLLFLMDVRGHRRGCLPFLVLGTNAMLAFFVSGAITVGMSRMNIGSLSAQHWVHQHVFAGWLGARNGSLAYAVAMVVVNVLLLLPLYRRGWLLRV